MGFFGKSFEEKVNEAVAGLGGQGIKNANYKLEGKVVTLLGTAHDVATKSRAVAWFNEQVETENTLNMIKVEVPNQPAPVPMGAPPMASTKPAATAPAIARADGPAPERIHVVERGDTLSAISKQYYGKASDYMRIFNANKDLLTDPDKIQPGQKLRIPE